MEFRRLGTTDAALAKTTFRTMADVFEEPHEELPDDYVAKLLHRAEFWAIAALAGTDVVGGLTAHTLLMSRTQGAEIFVYDIAVRADCRRQGIGRKLLGALRSEAAASGIHEIFVAADNEDDHALSFYRALGGRDSPVTFFML